MVDAQTVEIIAKKAGKTTLTEVDAISPDGSTLTHLVKERPKQRRSRLKPTIDEWQNGPMALMPFPAPGAPTKRIDRGTTR